MFNETELAQIRDKLMKEVEKLELLPVSDTVLKAGAEISDAQIIMLHIKREAAKLTLLIPRVIDFDSNLDKLKNLESILQDMVLGESGSNLYAKRALTLMSNPSSISDLFESDLETLMQSQRTLKLNFVIINNHVIEQVDQALRTKNLQNKLSSDEIYKALMNCARNYCTELTFAFGK